jgi:two-component system chemotaxis response regulator CheB
MECHLLLIWGNGLKKIGVLIIDGSALIRQILTSPLASDPEIEVIGMAQGLCISRYRIKALNPDVLTLDIEISRMDRIPFLQNLMAVRPMRVFIV